MRSRSGGMQVCEKVGSVGVWKASSVAGFVQSLTKNVVVSA